MSIRQAQPAMLIGAAVPSLIGLGCSPDADLIYRTMVTLGPQTSRGLRLGLGMAAGRVERAIEELEAVGAVVPRHRQPRIGLLWTARQPAEVVAALRRRRVAPQAQAPQATAPSNVRFELAAVPPGSQDIGDGLRHLRSRTLTRERLAELATITRDEHLAMNPEPAFEQGAVRAAAPLDRNLLARGVRMRVLGVHSPEVDPLASHGRSPADQRPDYRQAITVSMKLIVVDRKVALFPVDPHDYDRGYLEVAQAPVVAALVALFERQWRSAWDPREEPLTEITLTAREQALISLLAQGHTDVTAARELGISARSVSNILRQLMDRLRVENRFQLGLALGVLHTVPPPWRAAPSNGETTR
ncbi:helix-turn-helix transcriptional regulator [Micromonospora sp. CPCC 206061]|uniref:helix-turn-helix transcriptional regulator n=1 Tax=Micromonospora sp. CPCC 206061 TaxID=3122410 RepID=UPI002FF2E9BB